MLKAGARGTELNTGVICVYLSTTFVFLALVPGARQFVVKPINGINLNFCGAYRKITGRLGENGEKRKIHIYEVLTLR